jgi:hypothetical protein
MGEQIYPHVESISFGNKEGRAFSFGKVSIAVSNIQNLSVVPSYQLECSFLFETQTDCLSSEK